MKILIVEKEKNFARSLKNELESKSFIVETVFDGIAGAAYAELGVYDLLILDIDLPGLNGYQLTKKIRTKHCSTPILMLTTHSSLDARIDVLNIGADYCLEKPFDMREFRACVNALLRRQGSQIDELIYGNTTLELASAVLTCDKKSVRLSAKEFDVMRLLLQNPERNLSKEVILAHVWGYDSNAVENNVEVYIGFLRKKLKSIDSNIQIITIRRLGYHLEVHETH